MQHHDRKHHVVHRDGLTMSSYMLISASVAQRLEKAGTEILGYYDNGRRPVIVIRKPPQFVTGAFKQRHPNGQGGFDRMFAASYFGVQLEWIERTSAPADQPLEVAHA